MAPRDLETFSPALVRLKALQVRQDDIANEIEETASEAMAELSAVLQSEPISEGEALRIGGKIRELRIRLEAGAL